MRRPADAWSYAYLLGQYLGDGYVRRLARTYQLQISCDGSYPEIVEECVVAMVMSLPTVRPSRRPYPHDRCVAVLAGSRHWPDLFPQIGPGRKHTRRIVLAPWQQEIVDTHPNRFVRGLIHSDGCRTVNRFRTKLPSGRVAEYAYPRYFFSNLSADIRRLFCDACDCLDVRWTQSNPRNISIAHRASVAVLDDLVGPKA